MALTIARPSNVHESFRTGLSPLWAEICSNPKLLTRFLPQAVYNCWKYGDLVVGLLCTEEVERRAGAIRL